MILSDFACIEMTLTKIARSFAKLFNLTRGSTSPFLDVLEALTQGKFILVDSGIHSPVQRWLREITLWNEFIDHKTVEIRSWSSFLGGHPNRMKFFTKQDVGTHRQSNLVRFFGNSHYPEFNEKLTGQDKDALAQQVANSIKSVLKTVVSFRYHEEAEIERIEGVLQTSIMTLQSMILNKEKLPLFMIEIGIMYDRPAIRSLIEEIHQLGAMVVVVRLVNSPTPISDMASDIHIIERTPFLRFLKQDSEVLLKDGRYATVTPFYRPPIRTLWQRNNSTRPFPCLDAYNADPDGFT